MGQCLQITLKPFTFAVTYPLKSLRYETLIHFIACADRGC